MVERRLRAVLCLPVLLAILVLTGLPAMAQTATDLETVVSEDTTWSGRDLVVQDLVVRAPATLRLEGTSLRVGGQVRIEAGAALEAGPLGARPTVIGPAQPGTPSEVTGFWMTVAGNLSTNGTPATEFHGIRGTGLNNLYFFNGGGIQVTGRAVLEDAHVHDGNASLTVGPTGVLHLRRSTVEALGFLNIGAWGRVEVENSTLRGSENGIMALNSCDLHVRDSRIEGVLNGISANSCSLDLRRTAMVGATNGVYLSGPAKAAVMDTTFTEYTRHGIFMKGRDSNESQKPHLVADRLLLDPMGAQGDAMYDGLTVQNGVADVRNSVIRGNTGFGILQTSTARLHMENVSVIRNGFGMVAQGAFVEGDVLQGNHFGAMGSPNANERGQVSVTMVANAVIRGSDGQLLPDGTLKVFGAGDRLLAKVTDAATVLRVSFSAYSPRPDGSSEYQGPFTYEISHGLMPEPARGPLEPSRPYIVADAPGSAIHASDESEVPWWKSALAAGPFVLAGALMLAGLVWKPRKRLAKTRRSRRPDTPLTPPSSVDETGSTEPERV